MKSLLKDFLKTVRKNIQVIRDVNRNSSSSIFLKNQIYEKIYFNIFSEFESFLEKIFFHYLENGRCLKGHCWTINNISKDTFIKIFHLNKPFIEWMQKDTVKKFSDNFLSENNPITILNTASYLNELKKVRNAIAHMSDKAQKDFHEVLLQQGIITSNMSVGEFLQEERSRSSNHITNFDFYTRELLNYARKIANKK